MLPEALANVNMPKVTCKHFVERKKRLCRLPTVRDKEFCGEHLPLVSLDAAAIAAAADVVGESKDLNRIVCPLDPKHTVYVRKLEKHLTICNAGRRDDRPFIVVGLNAGVELESAVDSNFRLSEIDRATIDRLSDKISAIYERERIDDQIEKLWLTHSVLDARLADANTGVETRKHLCQVSAILGLLDNYRLLKDQTTYIEYGAGKGEVAYWLAQVIASYDASNVLLIDRASLRHKKDNKLDDSFNVQRIRADISDFDMTKHESVQKAKNIVGIGKHLCGAATDFAARCILNGNRSDANVAPTEAFLIALCCHHRCDWRSLVGKDFFRKHDVTGREFAILTKMVGWAVCGTRTELEHRKDDGMEKEGDDAAIENAETKRQIGLKCKRLIDFARMQFLEENGYQCYLKSYVDEQVTLENVCLVALKK